jgi:hypothetical protein
LLLAVLVDGLQDCRSDYRRGDHRDWRRDSRAKTIVEELWQARWRKLQGIAKVEFYDGAMSETEIHWYEAHGIGAKEYKIKRIIE